MSMVMPIDFGHCFIERFAGKIDHPVPPGKLPLGFLVRNWIHLNLPSLHNGRVLICAHSPDHSSGATAVIQELNDALRHGHIDPFVSCTNAKYGTDRSDRHGPCSDDKGALRV